MAISQKRYIDITSGVGGQAAASERELIARLMTTNPLAPYGSVMEFTSLDNVGAHFGTSSEEYLFAAEYFGFVSKNITSPKKISFARYASAALAPQLTSIIKPNSVQAFSAISNGEIIINLGGSENTLTGLNFSGASSLSDVASIMQTAINGYTAGGALWTSATVAYSVSAATGIGSFILTGGSTEAAEIGYAVNSGDENVATLLGWDISSLPVVSQGASAETPAAAMARVANISNNFGSFAFVESLSTEDIAAVAAWCNAGNIQFMYSVPVSASNYADIQTAVAGMNGTCLTLDPGNTYAEYMPMAVLAATNYNRTNATSNYMFQTFPGATVAVTSDAKADVYDNAKINYYGATQSAGQQLAFYQRGVLQGEVEDIGVYANEMWLKDAMIVAFFNLLLAVPKVPANAYGEVMARGVMTDVIDRALNNGTIIRVKDMTATQKAYISTISGDSDAWVEVYNNGYKLITKIGTQVINGSNAYVLDYILIYAKGDAIKKVTGSHVMI